MTFKRIETKIVFAFLYNCSYLFQPILHNQCSLQQMIF